MYRHGNIIVSASYRLTVFACIRYLTNITLVFPSGARSEALASALLELHGLQDMLDNLWSWVAGAETTIRETELVPIGNDLETVEQQLAEHEV